MDKFVYIRVADEDNPKDSIDIPSEDDGTLLLTTLQAQFPGSTGLRYKNSETGSWRGLRISEGVMCPPPEGWMDTLFYVVRPRSGKGILDFVQYKAFVFGNILGFFYGRIDNNDNYSYHFERLFLGRIIRKYSH